MKHNIVENYGWASAQGPNSCGYIAPRVLEILKQLDVKRVLDLGSGNGALCSQIFSMGYETVGVENDKEGVKVASESNPKIAFYNYGVQDDPNELLKFEKEVDVVVSTEVVEHLFSPHLLPIYAAGVLKKGGYLVISTPYHGYLKNLIISILNKWDSHHTVLWHGGHIKFWSRVTLTKLLEKNGFSVVGFSGVGRFPYLWKSMLLIARKV